MRTRSGSARLGLLRAETGGRQRPHANPADRRDPPRMAVLRLALDPRRVGRSESSSQPQAGLVTDGADGQHGGVSVSIDQRTDAGLRALPLSPGGRCDRGSQPGLGRRPQVPADVARS